MIEDIEYIENGKYWDISPNTETELLTDKTSTLNVPSSVTWLKDPDIQTGKKYAVSIENNLGIIGEWDDE